MPRRADEPDDRRDLAPARRALAAWYDRERRDLPWRGVRDPWAILVSEVMLQQTTVAAATPYWRRFVERWPTPGDLAAAERDELLAEWAGLGYYRRAHLLMDTALAVAETHDGALPTTADALRELRGIGEYTAAAVASIAHGEAVAAVDGNVERVVTRLGAIGGDPKKAATKRRVRAFADAWLDRARPGDHNQAVMELGATICRPRGPACERCPVRAHCAACARGEPERFPQTAPRPATTPITRVAVLARRADGRVLLERRAGPPNEGFLELPQRDVPTTDGAPTDDDVSAALDEIGEAAGVPLRVGAPLPSHRHGITRYRITVWPFEVAADARRRPAEPFGWHRTDAPDRPLTTASRRILAKNSPTLFDRTSTA